MTHVNSARGRIGNAALVAAFCALPAMSRAQMAKPFAELSNSALAMRDSVVAIARAQVGKRYRTGGTTPERGFDCSGLVKYVLKAISVDIPRTSREQSRVGESI